MNCQVKKRRINEFQTISIFIFAPETFKNARRDVFQGRCIDVLPSSTGSLSFPQNK
ncbi:MAG: hypothetical protein ACFFCS_28475 [Candidatus Hodarchaeota archaeon]